MNVIWRRPDGYHGAEPGDFRIMSVGSKANLWVHRNDHETFPFRVSGGWEEGLQTAKLNRLVNLLDADDAMWVAYLKKELDDSPTEDPAVYTEELKAWIEQLKPFAKGDHWEVEILEETLLAVAQRLDAAKASFVKLVAVKK